jgi:8-oxo-dGTP pyrophosphatase MutT (NUDIX family)
MIHVNARAIIERETAAGIEIVLQTRDKPHEGGRSLELPGGRVEPFESLAEALRREVQEETGLELTHIEGLDTRVQTAAPDSNVECLRPFAVYQTTRGPVDSMGVYFRCRAEGQPLAVGHDTQNVQWVPVRQVEEWLAAGPDPSPDADSAGPAISWIDRAGLLFYLRWRNER